MKSDKIETQDSFGRLMEVMDDLRAKCPWDQKQTIDTLRHLTIEETYELSEAILSKDYDEIKKELGDLLLHIVFYAKIGSEQEQFSLNDVINSLIEKLIRRHPHIYSDIKVEGSKEVEENWEQIKLKEKGSAKRVLAGVPNSLPPLIKAFRVQQKARGVGFDWEYREQVWDKVSEELQELRAEIESDKLSKEKVESEFGDLLFSIINAGRLYDIDPERALELTNRKFIRRFEYLEDQTIRKGKKLHDMTLAEMEAIWQDSKQFDVNSENV